MFNFKKYFFYAAGFLLSSSIFVGFVFFNFYKNKWSGNSPLNSLYYLPFNFLLSLLIFLLIQKINNMHKYRHKNEAAEFILGFFVGLLPLGITSL